MSGLDLLWHNGSSQWVKEVLSYLQVPRVFFLFVPVYFCRSMFSSMTVKLSTHFWAAGLFAQ